MLKKISDQTKISACYLLLGKVSQTWKAIFILGREGMHLEIIELIRSITENLDLVHLFLLQPDDSLLLKKMV